MTSPTLARSRRRSSRAFTLVEMLVVIGILGLLIALLVPMITRSLRSARRTRTAADLQSIANALDQFREDTGDYPRVTDRGTGFAALTRALIGPADAAKYDATGALNNPPATWNAGTAYEIGDVVLQGTPPNTGQPNTSIYVCVIPNTGQAPGAASLYWSLFFPYDRADGPGFRTRDGGKITQPYFSPDKFKLRGMAMLDHEGSPILYAPVSTGRQNLSIAPGYISAGSKSASMWDVNDLANQFKRPSDPDLLNGQRRIAVMMGDQNLSGSIDGSETPVQLKFILWCAGPDGNFGPNDITDGSSAALIEQNRKAAQQCDDVMNFR